MRKIKTTKNEKKKKKMQKKRKIIHSLWLTLFKCAVLQFIKPIQHGILAESRLKSKQSAENLYVTYGLQCIYIFFFIFKCNIMQIVVKHALAHVLHARIIYNNT